MLSSIFCAWMMGAARAVEVRVSQELTSMTTVPEFAKKDFVRALELLRSPVLKPVDDAFSDDLAWFKLRVSGEDMLATDWRYAAGRRDRAPKNDVAAYALSGPTGPLAFALLLDRVNSHKQIHFDDRALEFATRTRLPQGEMQAFAALLYVTYVLAPTTHRARSTPPRFDFELPADERAEHRRRFERVVSAVLELNLSGLLRDEQVTWLRDVRDQLRAAIAACAGELEELAALDS